MAFDTAAGTSLSICATPPATYNSTGYAALTFTTVGEVTNVGEFGKEFALVTHSPLASRGQKKSKGSFNNGTLSPALALDEGDAGQVLMRAASESDSPYSFLVTADNGDKYYMSGLVMSFKPNFGGVDDVVTASTTIEIDHNPIIPVLA